MKWDKNRIKQASLSDVSARYKALPTLEQIEMAKDHPEIFEFEAISVGDSDGQCFFIPLDESDKDTAEYIIRAIKAYQGE